jgi:molybdenum transport protein
MIYFTDAEIDQLIHEDLPYYDLTSLSVKLGSKVASISFSTRHETVICGTEEVLKIFEKFNIAPTLISISGEQIEEGIKFLEGEGLARNIHAVYRTAANLMEFASGIATRTKKLVEAACEVAPDINIATTRKTIPFTRKIAIKAVRSGGGQIHRLGLSDSILIFDHHVKFMGGLENFLKKIAETRQRSEGKSITIEAKNEKEALIIAKAQVDTLQLDKMPADKIKALVPELRKINPALRIAAAGNIDFDNVKEFAATGVDLLVTSSPYFGKPADFQVNIEPVFDV